jgi:hypothetical protein
VQLQSYSWKRHPPLTGPEARIPSRQLLGYRPEGNPRALLRLYPWDGTRDVNVSFVAVLACREIDLGLLSSVGCSRVARPHRRLSQIAPFIWPHHRRCLLLHLSVPGSPRRLVPTISKATSRSVQLAT